MSRRGENIRKRNDNRWEGRYIESYDTNGKAKYKSIYGKSYLEVKQALIEIKQKIATNMFPVQANNIDFREILYLWLQNRRLKLKPQTYAKYKDLIEKHIISYFGAKPIKKINVAQINDFLIYKSTMGKLNKSGGLAPSYVKTLMFIVNSSVQFAISEGYCTPLKGNVVCPAKSNKKPDVLSKNEQAQLEHYVMSDLDERKIGVLLSLYTGLRIGEICGLKWEDIDLDSNTIHVRHTVERVTNTDLSNTKGKTKLVLGDVKTSSSYRVIPIPKKLTKVLRGFQGIPHSHVLQGSYYVYTDPRTIQYSFHKYLKNCNLREINFHALRHTFATRCIESGMDVKSLSEILGHSNVNITLNTYVHSSLDHKRTQMETMSVYCGQ